MKFCSKCGAKNDDNRLFCCDCGEKFRTEAEREQINQNAGTGKAVQTQMHYRSEDMIDIDTVRKTYAVLIILQIVLIFCWNDGGIKYKDYKDHYRVAPYTYLSSGILYSISDGAEIFLENDVYGMIITICCLGTAIILGAKVLFKDLIGKKEWIPMILSLVNLLLFLSIDLVIIGAGDNAVGTLFDLIIHTNIYGWVCFIISLFTFIFIKMTKKNAKYGFIKR